MAELKFADEQNPDNAYLKAALTILFSTPNFYRSLSNLTGKCRNTSKHHCVVNSTLEVLRDLTSGKALLQPLTYAVLTYLRSSGQYDEENQEKDPMDMVSAILINFHCFVVSQKCFENEEQALKDCGKRCVLHRDFFLGVTETYKCDCGKSYDNEWDGNNTCQFFNVSGIFEEFDVGKSENLANLPKFLLKTGKFEGNCLGFRDKVNEKLRERLENAESEVCSDENCRFMRSKITFKVTCAPSVYLIDMIWSSPESHIETYLSNIALKKGFGLREIYMQGSTKNYQIAGILFEGRGIFRFAELKEGWQMEGLYKNATWAEVLAESLILNLRPVTVVYLASEGPVEDFNLEPYQLIKLEQLAAQCEWYLQRAGGPIIEMDKNVTGLFLQRKNEKREEKKVFGSEEEKRSGGIGVGGTGKRENGNEKEVPGVRSGGNVGVEEEVGSRGRRDVNGADQSRRNAEKEKMGGYGNVDIKGGQEVDQKWICSCGRENLVSYEVCVRCSTLRPGIQGWVCKTCKARNENEGSSICSVCTQMDKERLDKIRAADKPKSEGTGVNAWGKNENIGERKWVCDCGMENLNSYDVCTKCSNLKPGISGWVCKKCKVRNEDEGSYMCSACYEQDKERYNKKYVKNEPQKTYPGNDLREKTWTCTCLKNNSERNLQCSKCKKLQPGVKGWVCEYCKALNENEQTYKCVACTESNLEMYRKLKNTIVPKREFAEPIIEQKREREEIKNEVRIEIWDCMCGGSNLQEYDVCQKCYRIKPGVEGWVCQACKCFNKSYEYKCVTCGTSKNSRITPNQEFWSCPNCKGAIANDVNFCEKCLIYKSGEKVRGYGNSNESQKKNIHCKTCKTVTMFYNGECIFCHKTVEENERQIQVTAVEVKEQVRDGYWKCPKCKKENYETRKECFSCYTKRPNEEVKEPPSPAKEVDQSQWTCSKCGTFNMYGNYCIKCYYEKPKKIIVTDNKPTVESQGNWKCKSCLIQMDASKVICTQCRNPKSYIELKSINEEKIETPKSVESQLKKEEVKAKGWYCTKCNIANAENSTYCKKCYGTKSSMMEREPTVVNGKKCTQCNTSFTNILCVCKAKVSSSLKNCDSCGRSLVSITKCINCMDKTSNRWGYLYGR